MSGLSSAWFSSDLSSSLPLLRGYFRAPTAIQGIGRESEKEHQRWQQHIVQPTQHGREPDGTEQHDQDRREAAERGYHAADYSDTQQLAVIHEVLLSQKPAVKSRSRPERLLRVTVPAARPALETPSRPLPGRGLPLPPWNRRR